LTDWAKANGDVFLVHDIPVEVFITDTDLKDWKTGKVIEAGYFRVMMSGGGPGFELIEGDQPAPAQQAGTEHATGEDAPTGKAKKPPKETNNWKMKIQVEATSRFKRLRKSGASPTVHSIVGDVAIWCRENDVKTDGGIYPSARYLQTHVLGGKHWTPPR